MTLAEFKDRSLGWAASTAILLLMAFVGWSVNQHINTPSRDEMNHEIREAIENAPYPFLEHREMLINSVKRNESRQLEFMRQQNEISEKIKDAITRLSVEMAKISSHLER